MKSLLPILIALWIPLTGFSSYHPDKKKTDTPARLLSVFHFKQLTGGIIIINAEIGDSSDTLNFIFDTGCSSLALDSATCEKYRLQTYLSDKYILGLGSRQRAVFTKDIALHLPHLTIDSVQFHISDYELLSETYGMHIDGIIGYDIIKKYIIQINFDSLTMAFYKPGDFNYGRKGMLLFTPLDLRIPLVNAELRNGVKVNQDFYFDMGAGLNTLFAAQFVKDSSLMIKKQKKRKRFITELQGNAGRLRMTITTFPELKIDGYTFRKVPLYIFEDSTQVMKYPKTGGLIGNDLFRRFNVTLNYPQQEIYLQPNDHFRDVFDYSYTGLCYYFIDGRVEVTDVIAHSPAQKAGFEPGDIIVAVDKNISNDIQVYQELLKQTKTKIPIIISRNGQLMTKKLYVASIL